MRRFSHRSAVALAVAVCFLAISAIPCAAQDAGKPEATRKGLEVQVYLLVASREGTQPATKLPAAIASIEPAVLSMVQLQRLSLATTFVYRTKDGGSIQASGVAGPIVAVASSATTPTFYGIAMRGIRLTGEGKAQKVDIGRLDFNLRVPVYTGRAGAPNEPAAPLVQYENVGSSTEFSAPIGQPVVISTIQSGKPDELFVVVLLVQTLD